MATIGRYTLFDMFRTAPFQSALVTVLPLALALLQLGNSLFNGLSPLVSIPFAIAILAFAYLVTQFSFARFQRRQIEGPGWES